jgi:APA family basic amino acid/polyamine antiporter
MADVSNTQMKPTLGLTGLTSNAMALIAPGAFLWLTFFIQATEGQSAPSMWMGVLAALLLCLCTAICYAEMSKLYPGTGSSYYFAEQAFLNRDRAWRYARLSKFIVGWASHLYYWIYPGVMVGTMGIVSGYLVGTLYPNLMSASNPGMLFMMSVAVVFSFAVAYIAYRGANASTSINLGINMIQIVALLVFSVMAISYRVHHKPGSVAYQFDSTTGEAYTCQFKTISAVANGVATDAIVRDASGVPVCKTDAAGQPIPYRISYAEHDASGNFLAHKDALSVISPHHLSWVFIQATVAILILVGFESVTAMAGEAKNAKRDVPIAVLLSLLVQGCVFYFFEYFAANYFLNSGYSMQSAAGSAAPIGDMMVIVGDAVFGPGHGRLFMLCEAGTVVLALIGTTLSCMNTGARVTYAMGRDKEVTSNFGLLHSKTLTPHRAIWWIAAISAAIGCVAVLAVFGDAGAPTDAAIAAIPHGLFSSFGYTTHDRMAALPNSLLTVTLASNFGTFILYALSCVLCMVAYHKHPKYSMLRHTIIPGFGLIANLVCMGAYLVLPFLNIGTKMEPRLALCIAAVWGIYGGFHFMRSSRSSGRPALIEARPPAA